jgi:hypothetical protein
LGVDIQAYRKGRSLYVQTKCPAELVICDDEVRCQYHIDSRPLLGLRGDDAFHYCLLMVAPGVDGFGIHFAWIGADRLASLLMGSPHRRKKDGVPYEFTLRLRAPLDGSGLYYSYYGKKEYDLSDCVDAVPAGALRKVDKDDWDGYLKTFSLELRGDIAEKWVLVELLRRGFLPARPQMDAGVDVEALRLVPPYGGGDGTAKWVLEGGHYFQPNFDTLGFYRRLKHII